MHSHTATLSALALLTAASVSSASSRRPDGFAGWDTSTIDCPCSDPKLCEPITKPRSQEDVYAFHTTGNTSWQHYDWDQITTVCVFGAVDPLMLCKAHSVGARVTLGAGGPPKGSWNDSAAVSTWVKQSVARVQTAKVDGLNLDVEISQDDPQQLAGLVPACKQMADAMHAAQPGSHVSFDTPSEGETGSTQAECGDMYGRDYDYKALAQVLDFFVVMDYDSNDDGGKPCPTCYLANAALPVIKHGVECYKSLGVPASKLVLAYPWYGYDYTCSAGDSPGADGFCHVTKATQTSLPVAKKQLATAEPPGRIWQANSSTPHFYYRDVNKTLHRVDYDDSQSLIAKYKYAKSVGARGTGMWTASAIDYAGDPEMGQTFWKDLKNFANHELISQYDSNGPPPSIVAEPPCTIADPVGSAVAGTFRATSNCTHGQGFSVQKMPPAPNGYVCAMDVRTDRGGIVIHQLSDTKDSASFRIGQSSGGILAGQIVQFKCTGY